MTREMLRGKARVMAAGALGVVGVTVLAIGLFGPPAIGDRCDLPRSSPGGAAVPWVMASRASPEFPTQAALDGDFHTWWGAEAHAVQWIEIGLEEVTGVAELRLSTSQTPGGFTEHNVYGRIRVGDDLRLLHRFAGHTEDGDVLTATPATPWPPVCFVRIETVSSPSWVSWREIEVVASRP